MNFDLWDTENWYGEDYKFANCCKRVDRLNGMVFKYVYQFSYMSEIVKSRLINFIHLHVYWWTLGYPLIFFKIIEESLPNNFHL